jgi:Holliday junction resolvase RusA-like endonuclease
MPPLNIPTRIEEWNETIVKDIIQLRIEENQKLEYKEYLDSPDGGADKRKSYKLKIEELLSSFANAKGGFVIFGMTDDRIIKGVATATDVEFNLKISQIMANTIPNVYFSARSVIIEGRTLLIVKVEESMDKPISCSNGSYHIRIGGQTLPLPRDYLRDLFITKELKKQKYESLKFEVEHMLQIIATETDLDTTQKMPPLFKIRLDNLQKVISDYYGYFKSDAAQVVSLINKDLANIKKEIEFLKVIVMVEGTRRFGQDWTDLNSFLGSPNIKRQFNEINMRLKEIFTSLKENLTQIMGLT